MYVTAASDRARRTKASPSLRPAQRHRLCRDLRLGRAHLLGAQDAASRSRRRLRRRDGAGAVQRRIERPVPRGHALFLRQPAREPRPAPPLGMARLPVLHDERFPAGRLDRRLCDLDQRRRRRVSPLRRVPDDGHARRRPRGAAGGERLSLVRRNHDRGRSGSASDLRFETARPGLGQAGYGDRQRRACFSDVRARLCDDPSTLEPERRRDPTSGDAA